MIVGPDYLLLLLGCLLLFGILATRLAPNLGVSSLVLFMAAGMLAGAEGPGHILFRDVALARLLGTVALIGILFSSGIQTRWDAVERVLTPSLILALTGPLITAAVVALLVVRFAGVDWPTGALLGAVVSATDPVALASLLRGRSCRPDARTLEILRFESAAGTAMSAFMAVVILRWAAGMTTAWPAILLTFVSSALLGAGIGLLLGFATVWVLNHLKPEAEVLYTLLTVAAGFVTYGVTAALHGSGFLAVFLAAIVIGNSDLPDRGPMRRFHEGLPWLSQIALFVLLGLLVPPSRFRAEIGVGLLVAAALTLLARPLSVLPALLTGRLSGRQRVFIASAGLRGAVPVALATFPLYHRLPAADWILGIVAVVVVASAVVQGLTIPWLVRSLKLVGPQPDELPEPLDMVDLGPGALACFRLDSASPTVGVAVGQLNLPDNCLLIMIHREGARVRPRGTTVLQPGDEIYAYSPRELFPVLQLRFLGDRR